MARARRVVHEELVLDDLLADLADLGRSSGSGGNSPSDAGHCRQTVCCR